MANNDMDTQLNGFDASLNILNDNLSYVEDATFSWKDAISILVIKLSNTDSINKANEASNATQIQLTSERDASAGQRKTEDFFPTLTLNSTFKGWRIEVPVRLCKKNLEALGADITELDYDWQKDQVQIRRRILNADENGNGNPTLQICYGNDLIPLRKALGVDDYIVFVKRKDACVYEAFGVLKSVDLGKGKKMYVSDKADKDSTNFSLTDITTVETYDNVYNTDLETEYERNRIVFGAPGTGKSFNLKRDCEACLKDTTGSYERVTFHPDYTYSQFVGTYKPVSDGTTIRYEFVPGPFMRVYVEAMKSARSLNPQPHILIIEEINRAKVAAVFGDVFQLLDRDEDGVSEYEIQTSEDIRKYLAGELKCDIDKCKKIKIPNNMFIWATMNSADQGVFPMDTAFKRRWNFEYLGINENQSKIKGRVSVGSSVVQEIEWNVLRRAINEKLAKEYKVNEDKLMGPFFISKRVLKTVSEEDDTIKDAARFIEVFKSKVIMYLYEDAAKQHKHKLFSGCEDTTKYSAVCDSFDEIGIQIFGEDFQEVYYNPQKG